MSDITSGHFTNGTYVARHEVVVPTTLAGFQHAVDKESKNGTPLIIAVNSDISMAGIKAKKGGELPGYSRRENEIVRAKKVAVPLARLFPDRKVAVVFYDEETPNVLYGVLKKEGFGMKSLHKWGYGTNPNAGVIEGAENFGAVYAHPLPNDSKPICVDITRKTGQAGKVAIVDLRQEIGKHGKPYITALGECLFPLLARALFAYGEKTQGLSVRDVMGLGFHHS